ncbi:ATP-dependent DNA helicase [Trichonephila clavipes]|nr:ATP-dependent DNA helicase [Trichonephila clavipes]
MNRRITPIYNSLGRKGRTLNLDCLRTKEGRSLTIHESQGGSFDEIAYKCSKTHSQPLVYAALSRIMAQEGHIVPTDGRQRFLLREKKQRSEFTRLSTVHHTNIAPIMINKMKGGDMVLFSLNCKNLRVHNVTDIVDYIRGTSLAYTEGSSKLLGKQYHVLPLVLGGDFNIDFDKDKGLILLQFLKSELNLDFVSGKALGTSRYGTTINAMFSRFLNHVSTDVHVSYLSYLKPLVTIINKGEKM